MPFNRKLFSASIETHILLRGISMREAAKEAGVSASTMSRLTSGTLLPDIESFAALVHWLDIDGNLFLDHTPEVRQDDGWVGLYFSLEMLAVPKELIEAIIVIIRLIRGK